MTYLILNSFQIAIIATALGQAYFILLNKRPLGWFKQKYFFKVKNLALREVLFECDVCFGGQMALWISLFVSGFDWSTILVTPLSISFTLILSILVGRKIHV
jgi:hypothetical protein